MRILVTGGRGKVGRATADALLASGHDVTATDVGAPVFERADPSAAAYVQADLTDAGAAFAVVRGHDAVIHAAAIPEPTQNPPHVVFHNNVMSTFNALEAAVRWEVGRFVNVSSETAPGWFFAERPWLPDYLPVDEQHPLRPQDPYAMSKVIGEQLMDAAVRRSDIRCISVRPSWVQWEGNVEGNLGPIVRDPEAVSVSWNSYVDVYDLAELLRLAAESDLPGHEVFYGAQPDNAGGRPLTDLVKRLHDVPVRKHDRPDASGISTAKAVRMLGWEPRRSWRDYLGDDGRLLPEVRERLERGDTGVHRGRAAGIPA
jgi:nucleoside-diphosphate-sugar epimerase